ncbi:MAG: CIA30 family protein [Verrucomicrobiota bacterium]
MKVPSPILIGAIVIAVSTSAISTTLAEAKPGSWRGQSVTEFSADEMKKFGWQIVNDGVMGGLSKGKMELSEDGNVKFSGTLSLEKNGGFSMMRSGDVDFNLSNDLGLLLLVKGDGRTYDARLESDAKYRDWPVSFAGKFKTTKGKWQQVKIPFDSFRGGFRGRDLPDAVLDPSQIGRIGIILADKKPGPFNLEIDWIRTYGKGQGKFVAKAAEEVKKDKPKNLIDTAVADGRFTVLKKALDAAGLTVFFQWDNPLTVFAPTDEAFSKLPAGTLDELLKPENKQKLVAILSHHVAPGAVSLADALEAKQVDPIKGGPITVSFSEGSVRISDSALIDADVQCADGVIHVIDTVLIPQNLDELAAAN